MTYIEKEIQFKSDILLKGTLTLPENVTNPAIVVMLHGSGPVDRDENAKQGTINAFKYLADFFANQGIASLRYDKRGVGESEGSYFESGMWDLVNDGVAAVRYAKSLIGINHEKVLLLGHSEGCSLAPAVNKQESVAGMMLLAGQADNVRKATEMQIKIFEKDVQEMKGLLGGILRFLKLHKKAAKKQAKLFEEILASNKAVIRKNGAKVNAKWLREHFNYDNSNDLANITCPIIAITGNKDIQVNPDHVNIYKEKVSGPSVGYIIENMNHILRDQPEPTSIVKMKSIYKNGFTKPLHHELYTKLNKWLNDSGFTSQKQEIHL
ncbi:alpha/beta hydrolase [Bacillus sp. HMF5848]|uniref:alpha/beta hydrolase family protein n=1 Tax=Bacillus sp. HMF5848 TaxID=2495421 RepID=UPI000F776CE6|nr:alpha/beta hydrolase [Bacillus sp. HMF5848]RSK26780.1 alpha/beta hydrolase [Bacillus sp. HMF5848]